MISSDFPVQRVSTVQTVVFNASCRVSGTKSRHRHTESRLINLGNHEISFFNPLSAFAGNLVSTGFDFFASLSTQTTRFKRTTEIVGNERSNLKFVDLIGF